MDMLLIVNSFIFALSISGILLVFFGNPLLVWLIRLIRGEKAVKHTINHPSVSLITIVHNAEDLIIDKIKNSLSLNYPPDNYEIIIFSDGSTDGTEDKVQTFVSKNLHFFSSPTHEGKHCGINNAIQHCSGEILVFSDADAILESEALTKLAKYFVDPEVGGVCGQRIIDKGDKSRKLEKA
jgi:cellulose synthase/poly-beta-1,6-N-acetylglucosamine synthase-like glycosyltransferase